MASLEYDSSKKTKAPGMWAYQDLIDPYQLLPSYLGEGNSPLVEREIAGRRFFAKLESLNPSGSFKDRNASYLTSLIRARGIDQVVEDSSGNAGAALAFYTSAFGIETKIFVPEGTSGPKITQIRNCGAELVFVPGARKNAQTEVLKAAEAQHAAYASHAALPFGMAGYATIAFEIYEQLGKLPDRVFCPIGHGSLFLGILMAFEAIARSCGRERPAMVGVQPAVCAPLYAAWHGSTKQIECRPSLAEGAVIAEPVRGPEILAALENGHDDILAIEEEDIANSQRILSRNGIFIEPTSAMVYSGLRKKEWNQDEINVLVFTGNGLKSNREF